ncbi:SPOR domain-containing protein [Aurantiacibacter odishensis]|uniref:SPOR domain-containing protein n=1 Tax=Aurantiacibacter odishensis TaxID=1155476 RepID=UPI00196BA80A|nr:SPOR domain-containing protein [Aurantiacibacter odishensis]
MIGEPYEVAGTNYTPEDVLNYDEVGYIALDAGTMGYSASHHTLPVPSYVEVTSLESGRTILVRLERRGPMDTNHILALSPAAMAQLAGNVETPVRVRRVNPPEEQRAMLRQGNAAPLRMETPSSLLTVMRRRLPESGSVSLSASAQTPQALETVELTASTAAPDTSAAPPEIASAPVEPPTDIATASTSEAFQEPASTELPADVARAEIEPGFVVQAAAFANPDNARRAADALGGEVSQSGRYYRVRTGPFATRGEAEASLANVQQAGYSDARILTSG